MGVFLASGLGELSGGRLCLSQEASLLLFICTVCFLLICWCWAAQGIEAPHIYICKQHPYVKLFISYWSYLYFSVDVKDSCCPFSPTNDSTFSLTEDLSLRPGIQYILSQDFISVISTFFFFFSTSWPSYRRQTWLREPCDSTKTYLSRNECVVGSFQGLNLPLC